jgi:hypothetical protein
MALVTLNLATLDQMADTAAERGLRAALGQGEAILRGNILSRPGTGRQYGKHRASAPGQPPAPDTGGLRNRTQADTQLRREGADMVGRIVSNSEQAAALEKGTERVAARPFLGLLKTEHADDLRRAFVAGAKG